MTCDNNKSHNKPGLHPFSEKHIFGKTTGGGQIDPAPPVIFAINPYAQDINQTSVKRLEDIWIN